MSYMTTGVGILHNPSRKFMKTMTFYLVPILSGVQNDVSCSRLFRGFWRTRLGWAGHRARPVSASKAKISWGNCRSQQTSRGKERELPAASQTTRIEISKAPPLYPRLQGRAVAPHQDLGSNCTAPRCEMCVSASRAAFRACETIIKL